MNDLTNNDLWNKIAGFDFDDPQAEAPFSVRLARENGWTLERSKAAIDQYRRFIYMVCISDDMLSPSPDVDKVWHLHLIYTKDYWKRFCDETLGQEVHHVPSRGADESQGPLREAYARTLELLTEEFGETPDASFVAWSGCCAAACYRGAWPRIRSPACGGDHLRDRLGTDRDYGFTALECRKSDAGDAPKPVTVAAAAVPAPEMATVAAVVAAIEPAAIEAFMHLA